MSDLFYPTIDLFVYDFIEGLGDDPSVIQVSQEKFISKIPEQFHSRIRLPENLVEKTEHVYLFPQSKNFVEEFNYMRDKDRYTGYYYPIGLGDSYGLLIDCSLDDRERARSTQVFSKIKAIIEEKLQLSTETIGQTWLISGWLSTPLNQSEKDIAKACYQALMPELDLSQNFEFDAEGKFLGAAIFELYPNHFPNSHHVIVILYPDERTLFELSGNFLDDWMKLFYYRHKILWAYNQSRTVKKNLKTYFSQVQARGESIKQTVSTQKELSQLRQILIEVQNIINEYTVDLPKLEFQSGTIEINLGNYKKRADKIEQKAKQISQAETNLKFLSDFSNLVSERYLLQVKKDSENLERGLKLLENTIHAVSSRIEIEKTAIERNFKELVAVVGAGIAGTSVVKSFSEKSEVCEIIFTVNPTWCNLPLIKVLVTPSILFVVFALLTWLIRRKLRR